MNELTNEWIEIEKVDATVTRVSIVVEHIFALTKSSLMVFFFILCLSASKKKKQTLFSIFSPFSFSYGTNNICWMDVCMLY